MPPTLEHRIEDDDGRILWKGNPDLYDLLVPVGDLVLLPGNPRQGDIGAVSTSLTRFGQQKPIVADEDGVILAGNHTYLAAKALDWDRIAVTRAALEGAEKSAFALADNRLSDLASYDDELLAEMLRHVATETPTLDGTGYDYEDLDDLIADLAGAENFEDLDPAGFEFDHRCPRCGFEFDDPT